MKCIPSVTPAKVFTGVEWRKCWTWIMNRILVLAPLAEWSQNLSEITILVVDCFFFSFCFSQWWPVLTGLGLHGSCVSCLPGAGWGTQLIRAGQSKGQTAHATTLYPCLGAGLALFLHWCQFVVEKVSRVGKKLPSLFLAKGRRLHEILCVFGIQLCSPECERN